ncbi:formyltetrahydrofolate deformylase [Helicobacter winghamensis]|uniref:Formyltetrahydrofolate deformylase n=1 Tax=Helicobacter winghamensis TaxID=157268 RepID=A0A2N3PKP5_9HELI|nr:formyltetrahydrofolate deformylase [Helicobacter winghamensis]EEO26694.1 formyltetrahydrofolate deformylase [Helicobacter winghamensis ATCC BAA-430]PKT78801.1 formyltetrahydrofolate deformylase [Helicobacter winghamensis]PKT78825.1 formyltetrahydrofolate deformylase [Helicobacter winghamensis]PKT78913.1 formyltetrahydrofolate deformylase [Helicobacter winghamensis]PKT82168.1 formyltetrahydrofolate deformylase [Helicobacter winghamensis]
MKMILKIQTPDRKGLIAEITRVIFDFNLNILTNDEFVDIENNLFFMRSEMLGDCDIDALKREILKLLSIEAKVEIFEMKRRKIVILCTKENHCLGDLLIRYDSGELNADILAVISNYDSLKPLCQKFGLPFVCVLNENLSREAHEEKVLQELRKYPCDYIVLAKYMRILSPEFVGEFEGRIINIHHSFLPAFIGANPYKQAYERGVKIIGATAHFVNNALDEGPIIYQDITKVNHAMGWKDMQKSGRDVEKIVLAKALNLALEEKIFTYNNKTIVF